MIQTACDHKWSAANVRSGYLVIEGCFLCKGRMASFSDAPLPPVEDHREGDHFWSHLGGFRALKFDLRCARCSEEMLLSDVMALIQCMTCDPECGVFEVAVGDVDPNSRVCVALCADTSHVSKKCVSEDRLRALNEYFDHECRESGKRVLVVPCIMRKSVNACHGISLAETDLAELHSKNPATFFGE